VFKKAFTLKNTFLPLQKGIDETKEDNKLIYRIPCKNCDLSYIGETNRTKNIRMKVHQNDIRNCKENSHVAQHVLETRHSFDFDNVETLSFDTNWKWRTIKESLFTHYSYGKSLNDVKHKLRIFA
jgi:hypothetical protein